MNDSKATREALRRRIAERLEALDEESLLRLDAISRYAEERARTAAGDALAPTPLPGGAARLRRAELETSRPPAGDALPALPRLPIGGATAEALDSSKGISRRRFVLGASAGVVIAGTALSGAAIGSALSSPELIKLRALIALYQELEKAGLDTIVKASLAAIAAALELTKGAGSLVSSGISAVDAAVQNFERLFPLARAGVSVVEALVASLAQQVRNVQQALSDLTGGVRPVTDAVGKFFSDLLDKIPFGVGSNVRDAITKLTTLIGSIPVFIDSINTNLIAPLRSDWFSDDDTKGLKGNLLEPVRKKLLQPASALVNQVTTLASSWESAIAPINRAIAQRDDVRSQISAVQAGK